MVCFALTQFGNLLLSYHHTAFMIISLSLYTVVLLLPSLTTCHFTNHCLFYIRLYFFSRLTPPSLKFTTSLFSIREERNEAEHFHFLLKNRTWSIITKSYTPTYCWNKNLLHNLHSKRMIFISLMEDTPQINGNAKIVGF